jgi:hypothetical protein
MVVTSPDRVRTTVSPRTGRVRSPGRARRPGHPRSAAAAAALLLALAGCGEADTRESGSGRTSPSPAPATPSAGAGASGTRDAGAGSGTPAPSSTAPPEAADGTDLTACEDGTCEVEVKGTDMIHIGPGVRADPPVTPLTVLAVFEDGISLLLPGGTITTVGGGVTLNDALDVEVLHSDRTRAVITLSPAG